MVDRPIQSRHTANWAYSRATEVLRRPSVSMQEKWRHRIIWRHKTQYWIQCGARALVCTRLMTNLAKGEGKYCTIHTHTHVHIHIHSENNSYFGRERVSERAKERKSLKFIIIILSVHVHNYAVEYALEKHISDVCPWNAINLLAARSSPMWYSHMALSIKNYLFFTFLISIFRSSVYDSRICATISCENGIFFEKQFPHCWLCLDLQIGQG